MFRGFVGFVISDLSLFSYYVVLFFSVLSLFERSRFEPRNLFPPGRCFDFLPAGPAEAAASPRIEGGNAFSQWARAPVLRAGTNFGLETRTNPFCQLPDGARGFFCPSRRPIARWFFFFFSRTGDLPGLIRQGLLGIGLNRHPRRFFIAGLRHLLK